MEGSGNRSRGCGRRRRSSPEIVDLEMEDEAASDSAPVILVDLEAEEEDDDDIITLDDSLEIQNLRAESPEIEILAVNPRRPAPECVDLDSDSEVEVLEISRSRSPVVITVEEEEESIPGSSQEEIVSKEEEAAVAGPNSETGGGLRLSVLKEELGEGEASSSTFSMSDVKKEMEVHLEGGDVTSLAKSMGQVAIADCGNMNPSSSEDVDSSPQPSSSSNSDLSYQNLGNQSGEVMGSGNINIPVPVEREGDGGKTRIVYLPKPDYSSLSEEKKTELRDQLLRRIADLQKQRKFDEVYQRRYPRDTIKLEDGFKTIVKEDTDGVVRKVVFKREDCREADEMKADPAYELPSRPTPTYLELLLKKMSIIEERAMRDREEMQEKCDLPAWDSQEDVDEFCKNFNEAFESVTLECEEEKQAKEAARLQEKENRKKAIAAQLADIEQGDRKKTRLATGTIPRKFIGSLGFALSPAQSTKSDSLLNQPKSRKRKGSETETSSETELSPVPTLHRRPLARAGPSNLKVPSPPPLTLPAPEPETTRSTEELPAACPIANDAGWIKADEWEIECVVDVKVEKDNATGKQRIMYKVKWRGWERQHNCWVPEKHILSKAPIKVFWRRVKKGTMKLNIQILKAAKRSPGNSLDIIRRQYFMP